jgi:hypothetical protein
MKLLDVVLIAFAVALFMIGIHQSTVYGIKNSYWIFMLSLGFLLFFRYRRAVSKPEEIEKETEIPKDTAKNITTTNKKMATKKKKNK